MGLWKPLPPTLPAPGPLGRVANKRVRAQRRSPTEDGAGRETHRDKPGANHKIALPSDQKGRIKAQITRLKERFAVLERIAIAPVEHTARTIMALR